MYRMPKPNEALAYASADISEKNLARAILSAFLAIFFHTISTDNADISIIGIRFPVENDYVLKGSLCFLSLYFISISITHLYQSYKSGYFSLNRRSYRRILFDTANSSSTKKSFREKNLKQEYYHQFVKKRARRHEIIWLIIPLAIFLFNLVVLLAGIAISIDDLYRMIKLVIVDVIGELGF